MVKKSANLFQTRLLGVSRAHFWYAGFCAITTIIYDTTHLVTRQNVQQRWAAIAGLIVLTVAVWYLVRSNNKPDRFYTLLTWSLIATDILFAAVLIYLDRGMSSRNVALFAIPIAVASILNSRSAIFAASALSAAAYVFAATKYFYDYFNEGYKAELYGALFFYSACLFVLAAVLWAVMRYQKLS